MANESVAPGILLGIENPLLDIMTEVNQSFLARFNLKSDDAILASPEHLPIPWVGVKEAVVAIYPGYDEILTHPDVHFVAGGACQNSIRVCQAAAFVGCVGKDTNGQRLRNVAEASGAEVLYLVDPAEPTGRCAVLLNGKNRYAKIKATVKAVPDMAAQQDTVLGVSKTYSHRDTGDASNAFWTSRKSRDTIADQRCRAPSFHELQKRPETVASGGGAYGVNRYGVCRSMVTQLAAANCYKEEHLTQPEIWAKVEGARFYYSTGYFLTVSPPSVMRIAKHAAETNKIFTFNLAAPFVAQFFSEPLLAIAPYWDFIFGNEQEAQALADAAKFDTKDLREIALKIAAMPKANTQRSRVVVITHGAKPTLVVQNGELKEYPVLPIDLEDIVDSNGAGDAFVGGFLAQLVRGKAIDQCVRTAQYTARVILTQAGCTCPATGPDPIYL